MTKQKEWMIHVWGGAWNHDANPSIEKDYGIKEGYHYFNTEEEKNRFKIPMPQVSCCYNLGISIFRMHE